MSEETEIESTNAECLNTIVEYIDAMLNNPELSVQEISKHLNLSMGSISQIRQVMGTL